MDFKQSLNYKLKLFIAVIAIAVTVISISFFPVYGAQNVNIPTGAFSSKLEGIYNGDIDLYTNYNCSNEVYLPVGSRMSTSKMFHVKSNVSGQTVAGWQCYIYANAVYNKLFGEWVGHGSSLSHSEVVISGGSNTASFNMFYKAGVRCGAYMRTTNYSSGAYNGNKGHSLVILSYDTQNISYIEGNADGNGLIQTVTETWSSFNNSELKGRSRYICHVVQPTEYYYTLLYGSGNVVECKHENLIKYNEKKPTCTEDGYKEYSVCSTCGLMVGEYESLPKLSHSGGVATCYQKAVCVFCNKPYGNYSAHNYIEKIADEFIVSEANCVSGKLYALSCDVCGKKSTDTFAVGEKDYDNHTGEYEIINVINAECELTGYSGDKVCTSCKTVIEEGYEVEATEHDFDEKDVYGNLICSACGKQKTENIQNTVKSTATPKPMTNNVNKEKTLKTDSKSYNYNGFLALGFFAVLSIFLVYKKRICLIKIYGTCSSRLLQYYR